MFKSAYGRNAGQNEKRDQNNQQNQQSSNQQNRNQQNRNQQSQPQQRSNQQNYNPEPPAFGSDFDELDNSEEFDLAAALLDEQQEPKDTEPKSEIQRKIGEYRNLRAKLDRAYENNYEGYVVKDDQGNPHVDFLAFQRDQRREQKLEKEIEAYRNRLSKDGERSKRIQELVNSRINAVLSELFTKHNISRFEQQPIINSVRAQVSTARVAQELASLRGQELQQGIDNMIVYAASAAAGALRFTGNAQGAQSRQAQTSGAGYEGVNDQNRNQQRDDGFGENDHARALYNEVYKPISERQGKTVADRLKTERQQIREHYGVSDAATDQSNQDR